MTFCYFVDFLGNGYLIIFP